MPINLSMAFSYCTQCPQNSQSMLIVEISRSSEIQRVYRVCTLTTVAALFSSRYSAPFIASSITGVNNVHQLPTSVIC